MFALYTSKAKCQLPLNTRTCQSTLSLEPTLRLSAELGNTFASSTEQSSMSAPFEHKNMSEYPLYGRGAGLVDKRSLTLAAKVMEGTLTKMTRP